MTSSASESEDPPSDRSSDYHEEIHHVRRQVSKREDPPVDTGNHANVAVSADLVEYPSLEPQDRMSVVQKYNRAVMDYVQTANTSDMTEMRSEICERMQRRATFQINNFGKVTYGIDEPPPNLFSGFTVSLYLVIFEDGRFTFSTAVPGIGLSGNIDDDEGTSVLAYVSRGMLVPGLLKQLLELNLTWYDGCLLCEVTDRRRRLSRTVWTMLSVAQDDVVEAGIDTEQHVLLAQYPLLCLEPDPQVGRIARVAQADRLRWEPSQVEHESKMRFVARRVPHIFVQEQGCEAPNKEVSKDEEHEIRQQMIARLMAEYGGK